MAKGHKSKRTLVSKFVYAPPCEHRIGGSICGSVWRNKYYSGKKLIRTRCAVCHRQDAGQLLSQLKSLWQGLKSKRVRVQVKQTIREVLTAA